MDRWGSFILRTGWVWIIIWPAAALLIWIPAPRIPTLLADDDTGFLPADMPSVEAWDRLRAEFPDHAPASRAIVIMVRESGLTDVDRTWMARLAMTLSARRTEQNWKILATATSPLLAPLLESSDGQAAILVVDLPATMLTGSSVNRVRLIQETVAADPPPEGLRTEITGGPALGELLDRHVKRDVDRTTTWAFVSVTILLLLVYRSPIAVFLPVLTISLSLMAALGAVGWAASWGLPTSALVEMFIVVILAGSGVNYCLFLFARYREELLQYATSANGGARIEPRAVDVHAAAVQTAVGRTGRSILASGGTNVAGLSTLALAKNRDIYTSGPTISFAMAVVTFAVLTFTPALMRYVGKWLFWPHSIKAETKSPRSLWARVARLVTQRPVSVAAVIGGLLSAPAILSFWCKPLYDALEEYPSESSFVHGAIAYGTHFYGRPEVSELTMILCTNVSLNEPQARAATEETLNGVAEALADQFPLIYLRDLTHPLGRKITAPRLTVDGSSRELTPTARDGRPTPDVSPSANKFAEWSASSLGRQFAQRYYLGRSGKVLRVDLGLAIAPRTVEAMEMIPQIRERVADILEKSPLATDAGANAFRVEITGEAARYADVRNMKRRDFRVIAVAAIALIGMILVSLVASAAQAVILISATLLNYCTTYGLTWLIFNRFYGLSGLNWQIDFLLFIVILSLGQDYNIYVLTRIREACCTLPVREAIELAVSRTGRVVSSCGVIMAAAFGSMFAGSLLLMKEFAVALATGILIDTFLIRPLLVPSLILLLLKRKGR